MNKREIEGQANTLRQTKPEEALVLYRKIWEEYREEFTQYDALRSIQCARALPAQDYMAMVEELLEAFPEADMVTGIAAWYIFDRFIKGKTERNI